MVGLERMRQVHAFPKYCYSFVNGSRKAYFIQRYGQISVANFNSSISAWKHDSHHGVEHNIPEEIISCTSEINLRSAFSRSLSDDQGEGGATDEASATVIKQIGGDVYAVHRVLNSARRHEYLGRPDVLIDDNHSSAHCEYDAPHQFLARKITNLIGVAHVARETQRANRTLNLASFCLS
jgi:hypothetical protein